MIHHRKTPIAEPPLCQQILVASRLYIKFYFLGAKMVVFWTYQCKVSSILSSYTRVQ